MQSIKYLFADVPWFLYPLLAFVLFEFLLMGWEVIKFLSFILGFKGKKK
jgi:hypothetical protein